MKLKDYVLIAALIVADQLTKLYISSSMSYHQSIQVIEDFFHITYTHNIGAAFSLLEGQKWFFVLTAFVACVGIVSYINKSKDVTKLSKFALVLIMGGAIGNMIDRVVYGYVIDFLDFYIFGYDFPVFNFADCCITIGTGLLLLSLIFEKEK